RMCRAAHGIGAAGAASEGGELRRQRRVRRPREPALQPEPFVEAQQRPKPPAWRADQRTAIASALSRSSMTSESSIDLAVPPARFRNRRARASSATTSDAPFAMLLTKGHDLNLAA